MGPRILPLYTLFVKCTVAPGLFVVVVVGGNGGGGDKSLYLSSPTPRIDHRPSINTTGSSVGSSSISAALRSLLNPRRHSRIDHLATTAAAVSAEQPRQVNRFDPRDLLRM